MTEEPDQPERPDSLVPGIDSGLLIPESVQPPAPPNKGAVDNKAAEAAIAFLKAGKPLQHGTPDDPAAELAKVRKEA